MNPVVGTLVLTAGVAVLLLPRRWAVIPLLLVAPLLPASNHFEIGVFHFYVSRILLLFAWVRVLVRSEYRSVWHSRIDTLIVLQFVFGTLAYIVLRGTSTAVVNRMGWAYDGLSIYFLMRWMIRDSATWKKALTTLAVTCVVIAIPMLIEHRTDRNMFSVLGGVDAFTEIRDGKIRSQGPFGHPILAGVFAANLFPLFVSMKWLGISKKIQIPALLATAIIVVTSSSSTPFLSLLICAAALFAWRIRKKMRLLRWGILITLVALHLVMNNPVWSILARVKVFGGSTGWYRFWLLDNFIRRVGEWCLFGVESTAQWGQGLWDVTNAYVRMGVDGGLLTLTVFLLIIVQCYKIVGRTVNSTKSSVETQKVMWALGAALTGHAAAFFGVNYWDQNIVLWYFLLALIAGSNETLCPTADDVRSIPGHGWAAENVFETPSRNSPVSSSIGIQRN